MWAHKTYIQNKFLKGELKMKETIFPNDRIIMLASFYYQPIPESKIHREDKVHGYKQWL